MTRFLWISVSRHYYFYNRDVLKPYISAHAQCYVQLIQYISLLFHLYLTANLSLIDPQTASKIHLPVQMSCFYDFRLLACLVFPTLEICLSICSQLYDEHLKFQLFSYSFFLSLLIVLHVVFTFVFYFFLIIFILFEISSVISYAFAIFITLLYYTALDSVSLMGLV